MFDVVYLHVPGARKLEMLNINCQGLLHSISVTSESLLALPQEHETCSPGSSFFRGSVTDTAFVAPSCLGEVTADFVRVSNYLYLY